MSPKKSKPDYSIPEHARNAPRTKIVCTIGPATAEVETLKELIMAGMSVARINLSHGTADDHRKYASLARVAARECSAHVGVLLDLPGPKYRTGKAEGGEMILEEGSTLTLAAKPSGKNAIGVWPAQLHKDVSKGNYVMIDDGAAELEVVEVKGDAVVCRALDAGIVKSHKTISIPSSVVSLDYFTEETVAGLALAQDIRPDFIGLSCVQRAADVAEVRSRLANDGLSTQILSKIEMAQALEDLEQIVDASDAVMVARGDLGIEIPLSELPIVQKRIIRLSNRHGKPVITATQMMESMIENSRPTRAEVTDISNAIIEGTDAVMLSGETAVGKYPVKAVQYMAEIARRTELEANASHKHLYATAGRTEGELEGVDDIIAHSAKQVARQVDAKLIVAFTESGSTAARVSAFRPEVTVIAALRATEALGALSLRWGVTPIVTEAMHRIEDMFYAASEMAFANGYADHGDYIVIVMGTPLGVTGTTNLLRVLKVREPRPASQQ